VTSCADYSCATGGYSSTDYGWPDARYGPRGIGDPLAAHNCTRYAAFKLQQNGLTVDPGLWGFARDWDANAPGVHDTTPTVGAIAFWGPNIGVMSGSSGHVAYVEAVGTDTAGKTYIDVTWDNAGGVTERGLIEQGNTNWPTKFLHITDAIGEGSFVRVAGTQTVYRLAGGAPIPVTSWSAVGGSQPCSDISQNQFNQLRATPADGTFIRNTSNGSVYVVAGGAPLPVTNWNNVGGVKPYVNVDGAAINNAGGSIGGAGTHLNATVADGTFIRNPLNGSVYVVAGGAPLPVTSWNNVGGVKPYVNIDVAAINNAGNVALSSDYGHLKATVANGTYLRAFTTGDLYVAAGGAPIFISNWNNVGGSKPYVNIDVAAINNAGNVTLSRDYGHLIAKPADGTYLRGYSTGKLYLVTGGTPRLKTTAPSGYVIVDQTAINNGGQSGVWSHLNKPA
jgi:hypothetical protein